MIKLSFLFSVFFVLTQCALHAQGYSVNYFSIDEDSVSLQKKINLQTSFSSRPEASAYVATLPSFLHSKGFITASVDSVAFDSSSAQVNIFLGEMYQWASIRTLPENDAFLEQLRWKPEQWNGNVDFKTLEGWQQKILDALEENGNPFGKVYLDSIEINGGRVNALLQIQKGPAYKIDSIRVYGDVSVSNVFLQRYLDLPNGSAYNKKKLAGISKKLAELVYLQEERPSDLSLLGTGSVLNLYLLPKKSSQVNALIGFLPNSQRLSGEQKLLLTVDANILLRNALGGGETIGLLWQQLQQSSPRLNLQFEQPFIFSSPFGLNFSFDMYRRDSIFLNLNMNLGASYSISANKSGSIFLQRRQSIVNGINEPLIIQTKQLPDEVDVSSLNLGMGYNTNTTDYRFNPRRGSDFSVTATAGTKSIKKNNAILDLKDPGNPNFNFESLYDTLKLKAYQFRVTTSLSHYLPLSRQTTFKLGLNAGLFQSANYFRNELFQIGGYKLLRGFDEESQFVSQYAIGTLEYRYLIGQNSAFFVFADGGWGKHLAEVQKHHGYFGTGLGLSFETKAGIFNLAWAVGKRDDVPFNLRQSKVHLGFASYF